MFTTRGHSSSRLRRPPNVPHPGHKVALVSVMNPLVNEINIYTMHSNLKTLGAALRASKINVFFKYNSPQSTTHGKSTFFNSLFLAF